MLLLKCSLEAKTPFMIGNGYSENCDRDILIDSKGFPYIPGTSLCGLCRHFLREQDWEGVEDIFGSISMQKGKDDKESKIIFYDAFLEKADGSRGYAVSVRDSVRLQNKLAVEMSKFDYEIVEAGARFTFRVEVLLDKMEEGLAKEKKLIALLLKGFSEGDIRIGAKTTRGFGIFEAKDIKVCSLDLHNKEEMKKHICREYKWEEWQEKNISYKSLYETIETDLELDSFLFIRDYAATEKVDKGDNESKFVDARTLLNQRGNPVIPGTAWAGVFRHHAAKILKESKYQDREEREIESLLNDLFGYESAPNCPPDKELRSKSQILFSETELEEYEMMNRTRTAVDRFGASALQTGALFTGRIACKKDISGEKKLLTLTVKIKKGRDEKLARNLVELCIEDLKRGVLAVGGNTSVGAGIFKAYEIGGTNEGKA
ncbi:RAMP superfamily CRISPR-associated protein [Bacteroides heparinolyticus]|uniref:RAMP superfamily CRISPR-associated protein n=1 Tax=Prevotella heparinolytica TaxID=28113 RepID=UPI0035A0B608